MAASIGSTTELFLQLTQSKPLGFGKATHNPVWDEFVPTNILPPAATNQQLVTAGCGL